MEKKKILQVFRSATDAYLEFKNNFITREVFVEFFNIDNGEADNLFTAARFVIDQQGMYSEIDHFFQILNNKDYTEKNIKW